MQAQGFVAFAPGIACPFIFFNDDDSAFYVSHRHISRISKISYPSGELIWMMGLPEPYMASGDQHLCNDLLFSWQHDAEILENGNIIFFDNGIFIVRQRHFLALLMLVRSSYNYDSY